MFNPTNARALVALSSLLALGACGTIMHGTSQDVGISSSPTGATIKIDGMTGATTPFVAKLSRKESHIVHIEAPGYAPADLTITRGTSGWVWGNLVFGGLVGLAVDAISGGLYKLSPDQLTSTLANQTRTSIAPTKDGVYIVLVREVPAAWTKVGQLSRVEAHTGN